MSHLLHYTARHHAEGGPGEAGPGIKKVGILPNLHPEIDLPPHVWLTRSRDWAQPWATRNIIDCDRTEVRVEVVIPKGASGRLLCWTEVAPFVNAAVRTDLASFGDPAEWRVFVGPIKPAWLRRWTPRP